MTKQICKWCLFGLNILLIALLTLFSCIFLYFSLARPAELFGHTALLLEAESGAGRELCLLECRPAVFAEGDQLLIEDSGGVPRLYTAIRMADGSLAAASDNGDTFPLFSPSATSMLLGKAVWSSSWLGGLLYAAIQPENIFLTYGLIGGGFLLCLLALAGLYLFSSRRSVALLRKEFPPDAAEAEGVAAAASEPSLLEASSPSVAGWRTWLPPSSSPAEESSFSAAAILDVTAEEDIKIYHPSGTPLSVSLPDSVASPQAEALPDIADEPSPSEKKEREEIGSVLADIEKLFDEATHF